MMRFESGLGFLGATKMQRIHIIEFSPRATEIKLLEGYKHLRCRYDCLSLLYIISEIIK